MADLVKRVVRRHLGASLPAAPPTTARVADCIERMTTLTEEVLDRVREIDRLRVRAHEILESSAKGVQTTLRDVAASSRVSRHVALVDGGLEEMGGYDEPTATDPARQLRTIFALASDLLRESRGRPDLTLAQVVAKLESIVAACGKG